jgi:hypothetical protein
VQVKAGWHEVLDGWNLRVVLVPLQSALAQALVLDADWSVQYKDSQAVILVRSGKASEKRDNVTKASPSG